MFEIVEFCDKDVLLEREKFYIDTLKPNINHILDPVKLTRDDVFRKRDSESKKKYYKTHRPVNIKKVYQYDLDGNFIKEFDSLTDAAKATNRNQCNDISACCNGKVKTARKYRWSFKKVDHLDEITKNCRGSKIYQYDLDYNLVKIWSKAIDITKVYHITSHTLHKYSDLQTAYKGFYWSFQSSSR